MQEQITGRLWIRFYKKQRLIHDYVIESSPDNPQDALMQLLPTLDIAQPLWLNKHITDWEKYRMVRFTPDHFIDHVNFDWLDISYIEDKKE